MGLEIQFERKENAAFPAKPVCIPTHCCESWIYCPLAILSWNSRSLKLWCSVFLYKVNLKHLQFNCTNSAYIWVFVVMYFNTWYLSKEHHLLLTCSLPFWKDGCCFVISGHLFKTEQNRNYFFGFKGVPLSPKQYVYLMFGSCLGFLTGNYIFSGTVNVLTRFGLPVCQHSWQLPVSTRLESTLGTVNF